MANTVFKMDSYHLKVYDRIDNDQNIELILKDIESYIDNYDFKSKTFESLLISFEKSQFDTEKEFENALWIFLQRLHDQDDKEWDGNVSKDPNHPDFSFSIKGRAFYIVGMHPQSSRLARRSPVCTLAFNLHWQFEKMREMGIFQSVKKRIRKRDTALQGSINPVLEDFGNDTETKQYSGRKVENTWKCPFHNKHN
jgi:FPC/CPF motif-containing protein YcgG